MQKFETANDTSYSPQQRAWKRFCSDKMAVTASLMLMLLLAIALFAPFIANPRPLLAYTPNGGLQAPFLRSFFAPESTEFFIEQLFNYAAVAILVLLPVRWCLNKKLKLRRIVTLLFLVLLLIPFIVVKPKLERVKYRDMLLSEGSWQIMTVLPYGPYEQITQPYAEPCAEHPLGSDELGRDLATRIIYGSRISLAVGLIATALSMFIGIITGVSIGYAGSWIDMAAMRIVEILMCFPVFLLLLIVIAYLQAPEAGKQQNAQSILIVIGILALTGWIGMAQLARGEVLKQREMVYIKAAQALGVPFYRIIFRHILPNILGTVMITFSFSVAGAILSESALSFLGFGVQPPTASWGGMLKAVYGNPMSSWHLTFFPGLMLFWAVAGFNLLGEGLRKAFDPKS